MNFYIFAYAQGSTTKIEIETISRKFPPASCQLIPQQVPLFWSLSP